MFRAGGVDFAVEGVGLEFGDRAWSLPFSGLGF